MLEAGANRDAIAHDIGRRISPITVACACDKNKQLRHKMVQFLLEYGISLEFDPSRHTESCVHAALDYADCELLELLARSGADFNCLDRVPQLQIHRVNGEYGGNTPLHRVVLGLVAYLLRPWNDDFQANQRRRDLELGDLCLDMTQKLLTLGADVNVTNIRGSTALHLLFKGELSKHCHAEKNDAILGLLLDSGAELNRLNYLGESPLSLAAKYASYKTVKRMIDAGADVNLTKGSTNSALLSAIVGSRSSDIVKLLLDCGADINVKDDDGKNILWAAAKRWNEEKGTEYMENLKLIMAHSANKNCVKHEKYVPFGSVLEFGTMEAMHLFFENGVQLDNCGVPFPLHRAAANSEAEILEYLLKTKLYNVDMLDKTGRTALFSAVSHERLDCVRTLIEWGANVDTPGDLECVLETADRFPLSRAISQGNLRIVDLLLSVGTKVRVNFHTADEKCFISLFRYWDTTYKPSLTDSQRYIIWKWLIGRAILSQNHVEELDLDIENRSRWDFFRQRPAMHKILNQCSSELDDLKSVTLYECQHSSVTLFDLLRGKEMTPYVNNAKVINKYKLLDVSQRFPIYGNLIESHFTMALFKRKLMDAALEKLRDILKSYSYNCDWFLYSVMTHLSIKDLRSISEI
ncbi:hypothetical protein QAD02_024325 [Eretmocerus hayati]|uniref:Uncharacterized protein n=1 Tax=Eretmocerus hayati TaxID=131215 RepID=A0ACC2Q396_9HYME|nr:hypothetical protein QAD02_024325 [Eretmocerus hayati]